MLRVARRLGMDYGVRVRTTFWVRMRRHLEFEGDSGCVCDAYRGDVAGVGANGFGGCGRRFASASVLTAAQTERVFAAAQAQGLPVKLHAEQLSDQGGAELVMRVRWLSADHLGI